MRVCVEYRKLNDVTKSPSIYPLPCIDDSVKALSAGANWLLLKSGYWQDRLDEKEKAKTAFSIGTSLCYVLYFDDVLVAGWTSSEHIANLKHSPSMAKNASLKVTL